MSGTSAVPTTRRRHPKRSTSRVSRCLPIRSDGRDRLLLLLDFGDAADSANGFAVLALYDLSSSRACSTPPMSPMTAARYFRDGASLAVSGDTDAVVTMSTHFNSSQGYVTTALILPRDDRLELIDTIFTFDEKSMRIPARAGPVLQGHWRGGRQVRADRGDSDRDHDTVRAKAAATKKPEPATRTITVTYKWDDAASRYAPDSDALEKLAVEDQKQILAVAAFVGGSAAG